MISDDAHFCNLHLSKAPAPHSHTREASAKDDITARILSKAQPQSDGGWVHFATGNLAIQLLMATGIDVMPK